MGYSYSKVLGMLDELRGHMQPPLRLMLANVKHGRRLVHAF